MKRNANKRATATAPWLRKTISLLLMVTMVCMPVATFSDGKLGGAPADVGGDATGGVTSGDTSASFGETTKTGTTASEPSGGGGEPASGGSKAGEGTPVEGEEETTLEGGGGEDAPVEGGEETALEGEGEPVEGEDETALEGEEKTTLEDEGGEPMSGAGGGDPTQEIEGEGDATLADGETLMDLALLGGMQLENDLTLGNQSPCFVMQTLTVEEEEAEEGIKTSLEIGALAGQAQAAGLPAADARGLRSMGVDGASEAPQIEINALSGSGSIITSGTETVYDKVVGEIAKQLHEAVVGNAFNTSTEFDIATELEDVTDENIAAGSDINFSNSMWNDVIAKAQGNVGVSDEQKVEMEKFVFTQVQSLAIYANIADSGGTYSAETAGVKVTGGLSIGARDLSMSHLSVTVAGLKATGGVSVAGANEVTYVGTTRDNETDRDKTIMQLAFTRIGEKISVDASGANPAIESGYSNGSVRLTATGRGNNDLKIELTSDPAIGNEWKHRGVILAGVDGVGNLEIDATNRVSVAGTVNANGNIVFNAASDKGIYIGGSTLTAGGNLTIASEGKVSAGGTMTGKNVDIQGTSVSMGSNTIKASGKVDIEATGQHGGIWTGSINNTGVDAVTIQAEHEVHITGVIQATDADVSITVDGWLLNGATAGSAIDAKTVSLVGTGNATTISLTETNITTSGKTDIISTGKVAIDSNVTAGAGGLTVTSSKHDITGTGTLTVNSSMGTVSLTAKTGIGKSETDHLTVNGKYVTAINNANKTGSGNVYLTASGRTSVDNDADIYLRANGGTIDLVEVLSRTGNVDIDIEAVDGSNLNLYTGTGKGTVTATAGNVTIVNKGETYKTQMNLGGTITAGKKITLDSQYTVNGGTGNLIAGEGLEVFGRRGVTLNDGNITGTAQISTGIHDVIIGAAVNLNGTLTVSEGLTVTGTKGINVGAGGDIKSKAASYTATTGDITIDGIAKTDGTLTMAATAGSIDGAGALKAQSTLTLSAMKNIGASTDTLNIDAKTVSIANGAENIYIHLDPGDAAIVNAIQTSGTVMLETERVARLQGITADGNIEAKLIGPDSWININGDITSQTGDVTMTGDGSIYGWAGMRTVTGNNITLDAAGSIYLGSKVNEVNKPEYITLVARDGDINVAGKGVTIVDATATGEMNVTSNDGQLIFNLVGSVEIGGNVNLTVNKSGLLVYGSINAGGSFSSVTQGTKDGGPYAPTYIYTKGSITAVEDVTIRSDDAIRLSGKDGDFAQVTSTGGKVTLKGADDKVVTQITVNGIINAAKTATLEGNGVKVGKTVSGKDVAITSLNWRGIQLTEADALVTATGGNATLLSNAAGGSITGPGKVQASGTVTLETVGAIGDLTATDGFRVGAKNGKRQTAPYLAKDTNSP